MSEHIFVVSATVRDGALALVESQREGIRAFLRRHEGKAMQVKLEPPRKVRSVRQNAYMWSAVLPAIASQTGHTSEDVHGWCKDEFLPRRFVTLAGKEKEISKTTTDLTTAEFEEYLERIRAWAAQELGLAIPLPNEV